MAISRKPQGAVTRTVDIDELISRGGEPANGNGRAAKADLHISKRVAPPSGVTPVILRMPAEDLDALNAAVAALAVKIPRNTYILQAIAEKMQRER